MVQTPTAVSKLFQYYVTNQALPFILCNEVTFSHCDESETFQLIEC